MGEVTLSCAVLCPLVEHPSSLSSAAESSQLMKEIVSVVPMPGHGLLVDHRRLALEGKIRTTCVSREAFCEAFCEV